MKKIKLGELESHYHDIYGFVNNDKEILIQGLLREPLPSEITKLNLKRLGKSLQEELKTLQESTRELYEEFGTKTEDEGNVSYKIPVENLEEFKKKLNSILSEEIEVNCPTFKLSEFEFKAINSEHTYMILDWIFND